MMLARVVFPENRVMDNRRLHNADYAKAVAERQSDAPAACLICIQQVAATLSYLLTRTPRRRENHAKTDVFAGKALRLRQWNTTC